MRIHVGMRHGVFDSRRTIKWRCTNIEIENNQAASSVLIQTNLVYRILDTCILRTCSNIYKVEKKRKGVQRKPYPISIAYVKSPFGVSSIHNTNTIVSCYCILHIYIYILTSYLSIERFLSVYKKHYPIFA